LNPIILSDNRFADNIPTATDTASGYDVRNIADLRPYTFWQALSFGTKYLTVASQGAGAADTLGIIGHNLYSSSALVSVESSPDNATWTERLAPFTPSSNRAFLKTFTLTSAAYWRVKIVTASVAPMVGVVMLGSRLQFPYPPDAQFDPVNQGIVAEIENSVTGNPLGSVVSYFPHSVTPTFSNLQRTWVWNYFKPFWDSYARYLKMLFWAWDLTAYPDLVLYGKMSKDTRFTFPVTSGDYVDSITFTFEATAEP